jgi:hypothetical protein
MVKLSFKKPATLSGNTSEAITAACCVRFGVKDILDHTLATTLMSSYMGTGMFFGPDRVRMVVQYVPEPILAEAASHLLHQDPRNASELEYSPNQLAGYLKELASNWTSGLIDVGKVGEVLGRIVLSLAFDSVKLKEPASSETLRFNSPITVSEFLDALQSQSYIERFEKLYGVKPVTVAKELLDGKIVLTQWAFMHKLPGKCLTQAFLERAYDLGCGLVMPNGYRGIDLMIPVFLGDGQYSFITVQIKLRQGVSLSEHLEMAGDRMKPEVCFSSYKTVGKRQVIDWKFEHHLPYLAIYMDLGANSLKDVPAGKLLASGSEEAIAGTAPEPAKATAQSASKRKKSKPEKAVSGSQVKAKEADIAAELNELAIDEDVKRKAKLPRTDDEPPGDAENQEADPEGKEKKPRTPPHMLVQEFTDDYPNHLVLLGTDYSFMADKDLQQMIRFARGSVIDRIQVDRRAKTLQKMAPLLYDFAGSDQYL